MPNQSDPNQANPGASTSPLATPVVSPPVDLPPLPPDVSGQSVPAPTPVTAPPDQGSASPPEISTITSTAPKKKFGGGRIIATILGLFLLVGGVGAGYLLTQQPQLFQQQARECIDTSCAVTTRTSGGKTTYFYDRARKGDDTQQVINQIPELKTAINNGSTSVTVDTSTGTSGGPCTSNCDALKTACQSGNTASCISLCGAQSNSYQETCAPPGVGGVNTWHWTHCIGGGTNGVGCGTGTTTNNTNEGGTPGPTVPACLSVQAYSSTWTVLSSANLSALTAGTQVNFCVTGSTGTFDQAQFNINSATEPITTTKGQGAAAAAFCQSYTIPSTTTTVNVKAKIHDSTSSTWVGESF